MMGRGRRARRERRRADRSVSPLALWLAAAAIAAVAAGCIPGRGGPPTDEEATPPQDAPNAAPVPASDLPPLDMTYDTTEVFCDGTDRPLGHISGAEPGERLVFTSALPIEVGDGIADADGRYWLVWSCEPNEARLRWEFTATGERSGRSVAVTVTGTSEDPAVADLLVIDVPETGFVCDGSWRVIGTLSGADPFEEIRFWSEQTRDLKPGTTDGVGQLELHWDCGVDQAGTTWTVEARGTESGRTGAFTITGISPDPATIPTPTVEVTEDPFVCDGNSRAFAVLAGFVPFEVIDFTSPDADSLIDGRAEDDGTLPIRWQCGAADAGRTWALTATGVESGRTVTLTVTAAGPPPGAGELAVAITEDPFACDGGSRVFATISNFVAGELVDFTSPQAENLRQGRADDAGLLPIRWQCGAGDIDMIWTLTATGQTSGRATTITVTGGSP